MFLYACEGCHDLTESTPNPRGQVLCENCGVDARRAGAEDNSTHRAEMSAAPATTPEPWNHLAIRAAYKLMLGNPDLAREIARGK